MDSLRSRRGLCFARTFLPVLIALPLAAAGTEFDQQFSQSIKPFITANCIGCHAGANAAAQFDLKQYSTAADVAKDYRRWALVAEKLIAGEMPPKPMKQPPAAEKQQVIDWVHSMLDAEAKKNAGDPGIITARRLSNIEYNYSIRDLTGVDIKPAREFPVDPTNSAGFDNSSDSLVMSPSLINKYLQAAREVSSHLVLKPSGFDFAPHPMLAISDREKYTIYRIVNFYDRQPTDYADYFQAAWRYRHRAALKKADATLDDFARDAKISAKYLPLVWDILENTKEEVGPVARLQMMWRMLPTPDHDQPQLVREGCVKMRDYVVHIRKLTARQFRSPKVPDLAGTSQPLMNWKLRQFASHRRDFDPTALQVEGEAPPELPLMPKSGGVPTEDEVGVRNAVLAIRNRFGDPDLMVPAGHRARYEKSFAKFANVFPDAFYIRERGRFYPDDSEDKGRLLSAGFHNVMGYFRDDTPLIELILNEEQHKELETLWLEFDTIADYTTRTYVQFYFNQSGEIEGRGRESGSFRPSDAEITASKIIFDIRDQYLAKAKEGRDPVASEAINDHFARVNATIRAVEKARLDAEPSHLDSLFKFAAKAYRRPLTDAEREELLAYYRSLRDKTKLSHEDAMREMVVLVLMSPDFCYRLDLVDPAKKLSAAPTVSSRGKRTARAKLVPAKVTGDKTIPLTDYALASRLSYFLWASMPDQELLKHAAGNNLHNPEVLVAQARRMIKDDRAIALATDFGGNWLGFRRFEDHNGVDRGRFPDFTNDLRTAMFLEPVHFLDDLIRNNGSMLDVLYAKHTFVNRTLAKHYGMEDIRFKRKDEWVKVENARRFGRGGMLPMAIFLTRNSPGLRTSPVKRGYWVARTVLGEVIPPPPPSVPELPSDEAKMNLPLRQMLAKHRDNPSCAGCHQRFDGFGLTFEGYGPIGEKRTQDLGGRPVDTQADFPGGGQGKGLDGLMTYIREKREKDFVNNLCRKLLVYALGRDLQLSDEPLVAGMQQAFKSSEYRFATLIESVVVSPQFLNQRNPEWKLQKGD